VYVCDLDYVIVAFNQRAVELWGRTPNLNDTDEKFCGAHKLFLPNGVRLPHHESPMGQVLRTGEPAIDQEVVIEREDGSRVTVLVNIKPIYTESRKKIGAINCFHDISHLKTAEQDRNFTAKALERSDGQFQMLIKSVTDYAIYMLDAKGNVSSWNAGAERIKGYTPAEIIGEHFSRFYTKEDQDAGEPQAALDVANKNGRLEKEGWRIRKDGTLFWAHVVVEPIRDDSGKIMGFAKVTRDITERKEAEAALEVAQQALFQAQKMEAVGQLTGGLAHDFNNLLSGISGCLEILQTRILQGRLNDLDRYVVAAQGSAKRAAALTHRLLAFSRQQTLVPKAIDVNRLVAGMEEFIRRTVGPEITVEVVGASGLWPTLADQNQLDGALLNLCINARDAMPGGGRLTIETGNRWFDDRSARIHDLPAGQYVSLCVSDTGTGMTPEVMRRAFDPFYTTKPSGEGTGLGLSMIHGFARQSGGEVRIYSELGKGTMVCIYLPRHRGDVDVDDLLSPHPIEAQGEPGETVLVIDDEPTVRMLVTEVLSEMGYSAIEAGDAATGLRVLQSDARIDLVITDIGLPGSMNGRQLIEAARHSRPDLKALFITGYAENAVIGNGILEPGMHVLSKPFSLEHLASRIREIISQG